MENHTCLEVVDTVSKPQDALFDTHLINPDSVFFVNGMLWEIQQMDPLVSHMQYVLTMP